MNEAAEKILRRYLEQYAFVRELEEPLRRTAALLEKTYRSGGKLLVCGNGGSCADADHMVGELVKSFRLRRPLDSELRAALCDGEGGAELAERLQGGLPAINLGAHTALNTAIANDVGAEYAYAQQVIGYGAPGDTLLGISTSGNSRNILYAARTAKAKGLEVVGLTGRDGGKMCAVCDLLLCAPADSTEDVQDMHSVLYHVLCATLEAEFWGE